MQAPPFPPKPPDMGPKHDHDHHDHDHHDPKHKPHDHRCAISWPAIIGGTFAAIAVGLILIGLGSGLGFASTSVGYHNAMQIKHFTWAAAAWLIVVQWLSSGLGGYLTGRLRTKWHGVHTHEVFFRDTAHGFLTWAVATVIGGVFVMTIASSAMGSMHSGNGRYDMNGGEPSMYYTNHLFRNGTGAAAIDPDTRMEANHIMMNGVRDGALSEDDRAYLAQAVATHDGTAVADAEKKVDAAITNAHQAAEEARKTAATVSIFTFLSMLIGAFVACAAAALGGIERDEPRPTEPKPM